MLNDMTLNEFRFLDPPTNAVGLSAPVTTGQAFVVSVEFLNQSSGNPLASGPGFDQDGCQPGLNAVEVSPVGWVDTRVTGVTGDWVIRAVVDCAPVAPATSFPARIVLAASIVLGAALAFARRKLSP